MKKMNHILNVIIVLSSLLPKAKTTDMVINLRSMEALLPYILTRESGKFNVSAIKSIFSKVKQIRKSNISSIDILLQRDGIIGESDNNSTNTTDLNTALTNDGHNGKSNMSEIEASLETAFEQLQNEAGDTNSSVQVDYSANGNADNGTVDANPNGEPNNNTKDQNDPNVSGNADNNSNGTGDANPTDKSTKDKTAKDKTAKDKEETNASGNADESIDKAVSNSADALLMDSKFHGIELKPNELSKKESVASLILLDGVSVSSSCTSAQKLTVRYKNEKIVCGSDYPVERFAVPPQLVLDRANINGYYTLVLLDPDFPATDYPIARSVLHWLVVNIHNANFKNSTEVMQYIPPNPPNNTGRHRYVFLLLRQSGSEALPLHHQKRFNFNLDEYADVHHITNIEGLTYFQTQSKLDNLGTPSTQ